MDKRLRSTFMIKNVVKTVSIVAVACALGLIVGGGLLIHKMISDLPDIKNLKNFQQMYLLK